MAVGLARRHQLLEMRELADVHFLGQVAANRVFQRFAGLQITAREREGAGEWGLPALP
jgi:hypothetical protein